LTRRTSFKGACARTMGRLRNGPCQPTPGIWTGTKRSWKGASEAERNRPGKVRRESDVKKKSIGGRFGTAISGIGCGGAAFRGARQSMTCEYGQKNPARAIATATATPLQGALSGETSWKYAGKNGNTRMHTTGCRRKPLERQHRYGTSISGRSSDIPKATRRDCESRARQNGALRDREGVRCNNNVLRSMAS